MTCNLADEAFLVIHLAFKQAEQDDLTYVGRTDLFVEFDTSDISPNPGVEHHGVLFTVRGSRHNW